MRLFHHKAKNKENTFINDIKEYSLEEKRKIVYEIWMNEFDTNEDMTKMYITLDNQKITLDNTLVKELTGSDISGRVKIKNGMTSDEYYDKVGTYVGYKIFRMEENKYVPGTIIEADNKHGIYFTAQKNQLFGLLMRSYFEDFGSGLACISFKTNDGNVLENVCIGPGEDGTSFRALKMFIVKTESLNNYDLIRELYEIAPNNHKLIIYDDSEDGMYSQTIKYYQQKGYDELIRAIKDIHIIERSCH